jgi:hypothetical protein
MATDEFERGADVRSGRRMTAEDRNRDRRARAGHRIRLDVEPFESRVGAPGRASDRPGMVAPGRAP